MALSGEPGGGAERFLVVATIRRPHGIKGELSVTLETDRPGAVFRKGRSLRLGDSQGRPLDRSLTVEQSRPIKDGLLLRAAEFPTRNQALEELRGLTLLIPAGEAAPPAEDEVLYHDLVGCEVVAHGETIGVVREVLETGGAELLAVRRRGAPELLVPFVKEMVRRVDLERRRVEIDPPEGLLEL